MQKEILEPHAEADLKTYVVWQRMLPSDKKRTSRNDIVTDPRSTHFRDPENVVGRWFTENMKDCPTLGGVAWDAYYLFDGEAKWAEKLPMPKACATPVVQGRDQLTVAVEKLLKE